MGRYCSPVGSEPIEMRPAGEGRDTGDGALFGFIERKPERHLVNDSDVDVLYS